MNSAILEKLTICVPTKDRPEHLRSCLKRIKQTLPECNVIVCDNSQITLMDSIVTEFISLNIKYIKPQKNLSIYENFDRCISYVSSEYFLIIGDDDLIVDNYFFYNALKILEQNAQYGMVCGRVPHFTDNDMPNLATHTFPKTSTVNKYTLYNLIYKLPFPTITGCVFRASSFSGLKFSIYNHRSADTSLLFEILLKRECLFNNSCPTIMLNHSTNDHLTFDSEELKTDLIKSLSNCLFISNTYRINNYYAKIIYSFFVINRVLTQRSQRFYILKILLNIKDYNVLYLILSVFILFIKRISRNSLL